MRVEELEGGCKGSFKKFIHVFFFNMINKRHGFELLLPTISLAKPAAAANSPWQHHLPHLS